jgi:hypothetical protein
MCAEGTIKKLIKTPEVWFALNAQIDGVDPLDASPNGRAKYLVYIQRQRLKFLEIAVIANSAASKDKDVSKALKHIQDIILPEDQEAIFHDTIRKQSALASEEASTFVGKKVNGIIVITRAKNKCQK